MEMPMFSSRSSRLCPRLSQPEKGGAFLGGRGTFGKPQRHRAAQGQADVADVWLVLTEYHHHLG